MGFACTVVALGILCSAAGGCSNRDDEYRPQTLRIGVTPTAPREFLQRQHGPLAAYLQRATGIKTELIIPADSDELVAMFHDHRVDMAYFTGSLYVVAHERDQAIPLALRDADLRSTSLVLVPASSPAYRLEDLRGKRLGLLGPASTSGNVMPRYFFNERGLESEQFFGKLIYTDSYENTALWVRTGRIDAGVVSREAFARLLTQGQITERDTRVLWETPAFADHVWAVPRNLAPIVREDIRDHLLALASDEPESLAILEATGATHFLPASDTDFAALRRSIAALRTPHIE
jgi:phosphonate transport system substrate-binding protein